MRCWDVLELQRRNRNGYKDLFLETEVLNIIRQCAGDKAPGRDGFTMQFFKEYRSIWKDDLMQTIQNFHLNEIFKCYFYSTYTKEVRSRRVEGSRTYQFDRSNVQNNL